MKVKLEQEVQNCPKLPPDGGTIMGSFYQSATWSFMKKKTETDNRTIVLIVNRCVGIQFRLDLLLN